MVKKDLKTLIAETRAKYDSIGRVWCPILNAYVHFTSEGRIHLIYKGNRKKRPVKEQEYKLRLFPLVVPVLKNATEIQEWRFSEHDDIQYYAIRSEVGKKRTLKVRVIIKRTGDGQLNYHSVMIDHKR